MCVLTNVHKEKKGHPKGKVQECESVFSSQGDPSGGGAEIIQGAGVMLGVRGTLGLEVAGAGRRRR